jgi:hypothetical protein
MAGVTSLSYVQALIGTQLATLLALTLSKASGRRYVTKLGNFITDTIVFATKMLLQATDTSPL